ncbi:hypothetical protein AGLY_003825 [Aphis glycines]|uniref:Uncharacterized protein n=1 Tax=Aphis glycines TaxID=307491 RepID=A0A6G0U1T2_APHGL|nr:hypothetical protein AGLY_003825 [Aphis glycines]
MIEFLIKKCSSIKSLKAFQQQKPYQILSKNPITMDWTSKFIMLIRQRFIKNIFILMVLAVEVKCSSTGVSPAKSKCVERNSERSEKCIDFTMISNFYENSKNQILNNCNTKNNKEVSMVDESFYIGTANSHAIVVQVTICTSLDTPLAISTESLHLHSKKCLKCLKTEKIITIHIYVKLAKAAMGFLYFDNDLAYMHIVTVELNYFRP